MNIEQPLKIGRIARPTERALGISLTGEVAIYMDDKDLDALVAKRPESYLSFLEELAKIIHDPDFVAFDAEKEELTYHKVFYKDGAFQAMYLLIKRRKDPIRWYYHGLFKGMKSIVPDQFHGLTFVRPQVKAIPQTSERP